MTFRLRVNNKLDDKLLQHFPKDPYSDITILTKSLSLELSLAYLSIDSKFFADLPLDTNQIDLSHLNQQYTVYVLRALYGGDLEATSVTDLDEIYRIVSFLQIDQFINSISANLKKLHESKKQNSPLNQLQIIEFCIKTGIQKNLLMQHHFQNRLKVLQSSKNYLQLGKLSDNTLNTLLSEFLAKQGDKCDSIVNHILQNYFNRKNYRPADYFSTTQLYPLRIVWEKYHHKVIIRSKLQKTTSIQELRETTPVPLHQRHSDSTQFKFGRLANLPAINTQSVNLASEFFQSPHMAEEDILDHHIQTLSKQLQQKNKKIALLQSQLEDLQDLKAKKNTKEIEASIDDINVLKNVWRPRKSKQEQFPKDQSVSTSQYAFQNIKKPVQQERQGKGKVATKTSISKLMFS